MWTWGPECFEPGGVARVLRFFTHLGRAGSGNGCSDSVDRRPTCGAVPFRSIVFPFGKLQATAMAIAELTVAEDRDLLS